jgi:hypothetical protein
MKWTKEKDEELRELVFNGIRYNDISKIMGTTYRSIMNRTFRLGLKTIFHEKINCINCGTEFESIISHNRKFCNNSCSATFNNKGRIVTEDQKQKVREKLVKPKKEKLIQPKKCRFCGENEITEKRKMICEDCKINFYNFYKPLCVFEFDITEYEDRFDLELVKNNGWYKPKNRGNNLKGVSKDHMYSVRDGFINKIDPKIIKHPANCQLLLQSENSSKNYNSSITIEELMERIKNWQY